jgi:hypothetical protein
MASLTLGIQELVNQVNSFLYKKIPEDEESVFKEVKVKMLHDTMTAEEAIVMRTTECVEVSVHGQTTEQVTIEGLEKRFEKEEAGRCRTTIPSSDMLQHQWKAGLPLHVTQEEALLEVTQEFSKLHSPRDAALKKKNCEVEEQIKQMNENGQSPEETVRNIVDLTETIVVLNPPNPTVKKKMEREIRAALFESSPQSPLDRMMQDLGSILLEGVEREVLAKNKVAKAKWGALINRKGQLGENKVAAAISEALAEFRGMSVMGLKTHTFLSTFLDRLGLRLTYCNTRDPGTGRIKTNEVEHDHVSTWLEEDALVVNMLEIKTTEVRPWAPVDQARKAQAAVVHVKAALLQIVKDMLTFKELFPDILEDDMKKIR